MLYDITPTISAALAVWPGDTPPDREVVLDLRRGDTVTLSTLRATVHVGAHADAPSHYAVDGQTIDERSLDPYLGPCEVVRVAPGRGQRIAIEDVGGWRPTTPRVLFATGTYRRSVPFDQEFAALDPELVDWLAAAGVILVGLDTPSVDLFGDAVLVAHHRCLAHDLSILEGLMLDHVPDGTYELIALPLKLGGFDASPVRAILRG